LTTRQMVGVGSLAKRRKKLLKKRVGNETEKPIKSVKKEGRRKKSIGVAD